MPTIYFFLLSLLPLSFLPLEELFFFFSFVCQFLVLTNITEQFHLLCLALLVAPELKLQISILQLIQTTKRVPSIITK